MTTNHTVTCQYKNHQMPLNTCYIYRDVPNGIDEDIRICPDCFREHILKYYPDGKLAEHLRNEIEEEEHQKHLDWIDEQQSYNELRRGG